MAGEVITVYAGQQPPESWVACILIGGSAPGLSASGTSWQSELIALLRDRWASEGRLVVFAPGPGSGVRNDAGSGVRNDAGSELIDWYDHAFEIADVVMFWWPEDADLLLMSANLAAWNDSQRVVHGTPSSLQGRHLFRYGDRHAMSTATTLAGMANAVLDKIGPGARRAAGEREVPLPVWRTDSFQRWYSAQTSAGNTLLGARQVWTFSAGSRKRILVYWALHVRMHVQTEDRVKSNEVVISRPDISVVVLYQRGATIDDTTIVLVREFRSPASTPTVLYMSYLAAQGPPKTMLLIKQLGKPRRRPGSPSTSSESGPMAAASLRPPCPLTMPTCSRPRSLARSLPGCAPPGGRRMEPAAPSKPGPRSPPSASCAEVASWTGPHSG